MVPFENIRSTHSECNTNFIYIMKISFDFMCTENSALFSGMRDKNQTPSLRLERCLFINSHVESKLIAGIGFVFVFSVVVIFLV